MGNIVGTSLKRLGTCHPTIQAIIHEVNAIMELSVLCGVRSKFEQEAAFNAVPPKTKLHWPESEHNLKPGQLYSLAVDIIPYFLDGKSHYDWKDELAFARLAGVVFTVAARYGVEVIWGGDWDQDGRSADERFLDLPHFQFNLEPI